MCSSYVSEKKKLLLSALSRTADFTVGAKLSTCNVSSRVPKAFSRGETVYRGFFFGGYGTSGTKIATGEHTTR